MVIQFILLMSLEITWSPTAQNNSNQIEKSFYKRKRFLFINKISRKAAKNEIILPTKHTKVHKLFFNCSISRLIH